MDTTTLDLARLEFALTAGTHFLFVGLTLGLATVVAVIQTRATASGDATQHRMVRFWGQLYVINYAVGIVTGLVMELQLGLNWSGLQHFAGNVFGSSLALETITAFFVESTFLGLWIFGWGRMNRWAHLALLWIVTLTGYASAYWIMVANGFLQHPVGSHVVNGVLTLDSAGAVLGNESTLMAFGHVLGGGLVTAGLFVSGVSALHLRRPRRADGTDHRDLFARSLRSGLWTTLGALVVTVALGATQFGVIDDTQPLKLAVFAGDGPRIAADQAAAVAAYGPGDYVPSAGLAKAGYVMMGAWVLMLLITLAALVLLRPSRVAGLAAGPVGEGVAPRRSARIMGATLIGSIGLPFVALIAGWVWRETGRQPWTVFGLLRTSDAVSPVSDVTMRASLIAFSALFAALAGLNYWLLARAARRGPDAATLGLSPGGADPSTTPALISPAF